MNAPATQAAFANPITMPLIDEAAGEIYAGILLGKNGEKSRHIIVKGMRFEPLTFKKNAAWIETTGGRLATRREAALIYANAAEHFDKGDAYWLEPHAEQSGCAWYQSFYNGFQYWFNQSLTCYGLSVRSVDID